MITIKKSATIKALADLGEKIFRSRMVLNFKRKYPAFSIFLAKRFSLRKFNGLPLTIFSISIFSNLILLFDFTEEVINSKEFIAIDNFVTVFLYTIRFGALANTLYFISKACDIQTVSIIGAIMSIYFLSRKKFDFALSIIISLLGCGLSIYLGKEIFEIDRPQQYAYYLEKDFSFPSGHTTIAVAFYGLMSYFLIRKIKTYRVRGIILSVVIIFWILIGFSRLYLCVHYLSDVMMGYILGFLWLLVSICVLECGSILIIN